MIKYVMPAQQSTLSTQQSTVSDEHEPLLHCVGSSWILIFAHPGHELRAHHLMERVHPTVVVLTDGSGSTLLSRLEESRALVERTGARTGATFGPLTDRAAYAALMDVDPRPFLAQVDAMADALVNQNIQAVVVDAAEGFNPVHDVCHWIGVAATLRARRTGRRSTLFEIDLIAHPNPLGDGLRLQLDEYAFARKLDAIAQYAALKAEVEAAFSLYGQDAFRTEFLRPVTAEALPPPTWVPHYESVGDARVREGRYASSLRYASHVRPVIAKLLASAQSANHAGPFGSPHQ
jgi:hypothetical protein